MNYRHAYHAGNFADVIKHLLLVLCIDRLRTKESPFFVLDAHAGIGMYDLGAVEAQKTMEYQGGIACLAALKERPDDLALYMDLWERDFAAGRYPGSPVLAARMLRPQDRMLACELHPVDIGTLTDAMGGYPHVKVLHQDAYQALRAHLPPRERRGIVVIDPPYEIEKNEFFLLARQLKEWKKRWETGTYLIWYPIKAQQPPEPFFKALQESGFKDIWRCEWELTAPPDPEKPNKLRRTGVVIINPPYQVQERLQALSPALESCLKINLEMARID